MAVEPGRDGGLGLRSLQGAKEPSLSERSRARLRWGPTDGRRTLKGVAAGLAILIPILAIDIAAGGQTQLVVMYVLAVFAAALAAVTSTVVLGSAVIALAALSPVWNHNYGSEEYWLRLAGVVVSCIFAIYLARRWRRVSTLSGRLSLLDEISAMADGALPLGETLSHALEQIVPAAADFCMIDTIRDGTVTRIGTRVRGRADWQALEQNLRTRKPSTPAWLRDPHFGIPPVPMFLPHVTLGHEDILSHDPDDRNFLHSLGMRSCAIVPMIARGRLLGTLTLCVAWSHRSYDGDDLAFARALASRLALALDHAGLFSDLESVERRMDAVMARIPESVMVRDGDGRLVYANDVAVQWAGARSADDMIGRDLGWMEERVALYSESGEPLRRESVVATRTSDDSPVRRLVRMVEKHSGRERWGIINSEVIRGAEGEVLYSVTTTEDVTVSKRAELGERLLAQAATLLAGAPDFRSALRHIADAAVPELADECAIALRSSTRTGEGINWACSSGARPFADDAQIARILETREAAWIEIQTGPAIAAPVIAGDAVIGVIALANARGGRPFSDADLALAADIGARLGTAIETARLAAMRREIASTLQRALEPDPLPEVAGWKLASMYRPAGELNDVGGDFYEVVEVENGWMVVVGDVLGRGASATALTAVARNTLRTALALTGDPREALRVLNDLLSEREDNPLCSVAIAVLPDTDESEPAEALLTCAGHPLPLLIRGEEVAEACRPGPLLGAIPDATWTLDLVALDPGDQLVIYTDGIIEARVDDGFLGETGLADCLRSADTPGAAIEQIETALATEAIDVADDAAAVVLMRLPSPAPRAESSPADRLAAADPG